MKETIFLTAFSLLAFAQGAVAGDNIVCSLQRVKAVAGQPSYVSAKLNLQNLSQDDSVYSDSLFVGDDAFSFNMSASKEQGGLSIDVVFQENQNVQDEVGSSAWLISNEEISSIQKSKKVVTEPLEMDGKTVANFVCYYNKN